MLLDTSGLMCLLDRRDFRHRDALEFYNAAPSRLTHGDVLAEFVALTHVRGVPRAAALAFVADLLDDIEVEIVWVDEQLHKGALALLQERLDKVWSLCDAASFLLMQQRGLTEALTTDHHFEQAGFIRLLKS
ncbi:MAG TPA: PIN domain-containing protein [Pyrinomonadaceae bacterium]|jgi:predicted nucleic acid-binding protein|nr:PIN domain-containing protein [Pyrinomonadaceae bacterium]